MTTTRFEMPEPVAPMLASAGPPPAGPSWAFEFKWDGVRAIAAVAGDQVRLYSRNGNDITGGYPELTGLSGLVGGRPTLLDGEIVTLGQAGRPEFGLLQHRMHVRAPSPELVARIPISYYVFDLLDFDGRRLLSQSYQQRRELLAALELDDGSPLIRVPPNYPDVNGGALLQVARQHGLEGVVGKRLPSRYEPGRRSPAWIKTALFHTQEVVVGGWTTGQGRRAGTLGALLLGAYDGQGQLRYLGDVGTGFTEGMLADLLTRLTALHQPDSPFDEPVPHEHARRAHWVHAQLVGEVEYRNVTLDRRLRHTTWRGLRTDKDPAQVTFNGGGGAVSDSPERLREYRAKRDFSVTGEPAGSEPAAGSGRFVVQRHRARRLHYDLRLEIAGVLVSWAVPRGPTLDPKARQLAVHVEDHPVEYFDFEGVIPKGEYGGGDVIVWDWGTWQPSGTNDPARAIERGELHFDLHGEKLAGRFVLVRSGEARPSKEQWLLIHKNDDHARSGWNPEEHPRSVKSGRTNDEVAAAPESMWRSDLPPSQAAISLATASAPAGPAPAWDGPTEDELAALDMLGTKGRWAIQGHDVALTNLDKELFPARGSEPPVTKRDLIRYHAVIAPLMLRYLADRPVNAHRFPNGVQRPGFWHKEVPAHAPQWLTRWHNAEADSGKTQYYAVIDSVAALVWMANNAAVELHPWTSGLSDVHQPTWALIDIDPGPASSFDDVLVLARLYRVALEHLGVAAMPKVTGQRGVQIWVPVRAGYSFDETRTWVEQVSRAVGRTVPELISWEWHKDRRKGLARLDYTQNALNKTLVAPFSARPAPGAPVSVPISWDELPDPELVPDRWTIRTVIDRVRDVGDPLAPLIGLEQQLPTL